MPEVSIHKAAKDELDTAFQIVSEYYESAGVVARDSKEHFLRQYFGDGAGVWLATTNGTIVGCIALRDLPELPGSGEIKRLYVQPAHRGSGIAKQLLNALEQFALNAGYDWLYLDSAPGMDTAVHFYRRSGYERCPRYNQNPQANIHLRKKNR
jgi:ribosomal protein S18 acetylase RimI-like enzyme